MDAHQKALYRLIFHAHKAKSVGMAFQDLFTRIMGYARFYPRQTSGARGGLEERRT